MLDKIIKYAKRPSLILIKLDRLNIIRLPDKIYLKIMYVEKLGKQLNLDNPQTFNEKLQWLKLYDRNPEYTKLVDKYAVREHIKDTIGEEYLIPLLGVWDKFDDIDFVSLPNQFVLKCNHDSGTVIICKDKSAFNIKSARRKINKALRKNYFYHGREYSYKNIKPKIICEQYMVDESGYELKDYKIFTFSGQSKYIQVDFDRFNNHRRNIYTTDWGYCDMAIKYPNDVNVQIKRPIQLDKILELATTLSESTKHVRVDFYYINDQIYFGELTFYHECGFGKFTPEIWDYKFGELLSIKL